MTNLHRFAPFYADIGRRAAVKLAERTIRWQTRAAPAAPDERRLAGRVDALHELAGGAGVAQAADLRSAALYDGDRLNRFLAAARQPDFSEDPLFGRIVTVELALRAAGAALD